MASPLLQIQAALQRYLQDQLKLHEFENVFLPLLWDMDSDVEDSATAFAGRINNLISEYSRGDRTESSLRQELENSIPLSGENYTVDQPGRMVAQSNAGVGTSEAMLSAA